MPRVWFIVPYTRPLGKNRGQNLAGNLQKKPPAVIHSALTKGLVAVAAADVMLVVIPAGFTVIGQFKIVHHAVSIKF